MIARLSGRLLRKTPGALVVDVNGVGYEVFVSLNTFSALPGEGETVQLEIATQVRESAFELFGFQTLLEKRLFLLLLGVSGVGPRMGLAILSGLPPTELIDALATGDLTRLVGVPGIGRKRAERLVVELRDRAAELQLVSKQDGQARTRLEDEATSALVNLGYRAADAERAVRDVAAQTAGDLAGMIRAALQRLSA